MRAVVVMAIACLSIVGPHAALSAETDSKTATPEKQDAIPEIVVTAQKRSERLQDVPVTVHALSSEILETQGIVQLSDYEKQVPGLVVKGGAAGPGQGEVIIRGISSGKDTSAVVGMYLDDVSFTGNSTFQSAANISTLDPDLADVERVEILEGPQSTLYGANALGGVIKIVTKQPDLNNFGGSIQVTGTQVDGGGAGYGVRGTVNIPIVPGSVALRVTAVDRKDPGFVDNLATGQTNINNDTVKGGRALLLIKISDKLQTTFSGVWQEINQQGPNAILLNPATNQPVDGLAYTEPKFPLGNKIINRLLSNTTTWDVNFATLTNIASYTGTYILANYDYSVYATYLPFYGLPALPPGYGVQAVGPKNTTRYSDELRLTSAPGRFEWLVGGFYTDETFHYPFDLIGTDPNGHVVPPTSPYHVDFYEYDQIADYKEYSAFGDFTYHFTDQIQATVGVRESHSEQPFKFTNTGIFAVADEQGTESGSATTYLATVSYKPQSNLTLYARVASGFNPGGTQALSPDAVAAGLSASYKPDTLWNYEIGTKGSFWNGRGTFTADAYHMKWSDIQLTVLEGNYIQITNAATAESNGAEASLKLSPMDGLTLSVSGAYNDAKLTSDVPSIGLVDGTPLPYSRKFSGVANADYSHPITDSLSGQIGFSYVYNSKSHTSLNNGTSYLLPPYGELDLRAALKWSRYTVMLRGNNVFNKFALSDAAATQGLSSPFQGTIIMPRNVAMSITASF